MDKAYQSNVLERIAPFLISSRVQFKAPKSLNELAKLNSGLFYGYEQVGKFVSIYPTDEEQAVMLAHKLHQLTFEFNPVNVPFDNQFQKNSSVFYRYGAFSTIQTTDKHGKKVFAIKNHDGKLIPDDKSQAVPNWLSDPFQKTMKETGDSFISTPLDISYRIFRAITQRGKGGTYQALNLNQNPGALCIVKEGRRHGEVGWDNQDGFDLVQNELNVLTELQKQNSDAPKIISEFEVCGNFYVVMEYVEGKSLHNLMKFRKRRFSVRQVVSFALETIRLIENIHRAGWVWNDCKPSNLIVTKNKKLRPIDFENAYRTNEKPAFNWNTKGFTRAAKDSLKADGKMNDIYALGAVIFFLLTGRLYEADMTVPISRLRRNVPKKLASITQRLLSTEQLDITKVKGELELLSL